MEDDDHLLVLQYRVSADDHKLAWDGGNIPQTFEIEHEGATWQVEVRVMQTEDAPVNPPKGTIAHLTKWFRENAYGNSRWRRFRLCGFECIHPNVSKPEARTNSRG
jgi:hypothetical protein